MMDPEFLGEDIGPDEKIEDLKQKINQLSLRHDQLGRQINQLETTDGDQWVVIEVLLFALRDALRVQWRMASRPPEAEFRATIQAIAAAIEPYLESHE